MNMNEMSDNAFWVSIVSVITGCITAVVLGAMATSIIETKVCVDAGYTQTILPGRSVIVWVKEAK